MIAEKVLQVRFLAENKRGEPKSGLKIGAPAIEVQVKPVESRDGRIDAIETNDCEALILGPYAAFKASSAGLRQRRDVENEATHFTEELAANVVKLIVLAIEQVRIQINHLEEAFGNVGGLKESAKVRYWIKLIQLAFLPRKHGLVHNALVKIGLAEVVVVAHRNCAHVLVRLHVLDIRFNDWLVATDCGVFLVLTSDDFIDCLVDGNG